jgi:hypothetical protein
MFILIVECLCFRSDTPRTTQPDELLENENFTWPLDPQLPLANRKQQLIAYMRR